jgi:hypothetical protein
VRLLHNAEYFVREILPLVHRDLPQVRLYIESNAMPEAIRALSSPLIEPVGYVPNVTPWLERARVFVAPLRRGAGMKGKVGQSLSCGLPVVTTAVGAEGMGLAMRSRPLPPLSRRTSPTRSGASTLTMTCGARSGRPARS